VNVLVIVRLSAGECERRFVGTSRVGLYDRPSRPGEARRGGAGRDCLCDVHTMVPSGGPSGGQYRRVNTLCPGPGPGY